MVDQVASRDRIARFVSDHNLALSVVSCTDTATRIGHDQHRLEDAGLRVLGEAITTALLLGTRLKGQGLLTFHLATDGLIESLRVDAIGLGYVRALIGDAAREATRDWNGFDALLGDGRLSVTRKLADRDQPYQSIVEVDRGSVASITNTYLRQSEQVKAVLGVDVQTEGPVVTQADGMYLEALPDCVIDELPDTLQDLLRGGSIDLDLEHDDDQDLVDELFGAGTFRHLQSYPVAFTCSCSRDRYIRTLRGFAKENLIKLTNDQGVIEATCDFCKTSYPIPLDEVI